MPSAATATTFSFLSVQKRKITIDNDFFSLFRATNELCDRMKKSEFVEWRTSYETFHFGFFIFSSADIFFLLARNLADRKSALSSLTALSKSLQAVPSKNGRLAPGTTRLSFLYLDNFSLHFFFSDTAKEVKCRVQSKRECLR